MTKMVERCHIHIIRTHTHACMHAHTHAHTRRLYKIEGQGHCHTATQYFKIFNFLSTLYIEVLIVGLNFSVVNFILFQCAKSVELCVKISCALILTFFV